MIDELDETRGVVSVEIRSDMLGSWWAYITQGPRTIHHGSNVRKIGRKFKSNQEAWQWAMRKISSIQKP